MTKTLAWESLILLYGSEDNIRLVANRFRDEVPMETSDLRATLDKYLRGWRPDHD